MPQGSLNPGVGNFVYDMLAPELADGTTISTNTTGAWVLVDRPWDVAVVLGTGTVTGTGSCLVAIEAADDSSGTNTVVLGTIAVGSDDDDLEKILVTQTHKPYMRADFVVTGTVGLPAQIDVRDQDYHLSEGRSA